jgi:hypothetical protein
MAATIPRLRVADSAERLQSAKLTQAFVTVCPPEFDPLQEQAQGLVLASSLMFI